MSEVLDPPMTGQLTDPVAAVLGALGESLDELVTLASTGPGGALWALSGPELLDATAGLHRLANRADAVLHSLVREIDVRGAAEAAGAPRTAGWLKARLRMHPGAAARLVATARGLHDDPAGPLVPPCPEPQSHPDRGADRAGRAGLRAAFARGDIGAEHAQVVCDTVRNLPGGVGAEVVGQAEDFLLEQALIHDPKGLRLLARHLRHRLDPDAGDTLGEQEARAVEERSLHIAEKANGGSRIRGELDPELTAALRAALSPLAAPQPGPDGAKDPRPAARRNADALAELLRRASAAQTVTASHGANATVTITIALETLERRVGAPGAWLDWAGPVSAQTARRIACDAGVIPVLLGACGEPLDVGRASYPVTTAIWRALVARDRGCAFAGCDRPPEWCQAHHIWHWADGGPTAVTNMCLLCTRHHRAVHHDGWQVILADGQILTIPPPWVDPDRAPRRNTGRDLHHDVHSLPDHPPRRPRPPTPAERQPRSDPDPPAGEQG